MKRKMQREKSGSLASSGKWAIEQQLRLGKDRCESGRVACAHGAIDVGVAEPIESGRNAREFAHFVVVRLSDLLQGWLELESPLGEDKFHLDFGKILVQTLKTHLICDLQHLIIVMMIVMTRRC